MRNSLSLAIAVYILTEKHKVILIGTKPELTILDELPMITDIDVLQPYRDIPNLLPYQYEYPKQKLVKIKQARQVSIRQSMRSVNRNR